MSHQRRITLITITTLTLVTMVAAITAITVLYRAAFEQQRDHLRDLVQSRARLLEAVVRFDAVHSEYDHPEGARAATLNQIIDAHDYYEGLGRTGEFMLAERRGEQIVFLLCHGHENLDNPHPVAWNADVAEPMRRALLGLSGTITGLDYRGEMVLAAYEPVADLQVGLVCKIDLAEIRRPFVVAGMIAIGVAFTGIVLGAVGIVRLTGPLVSQLSLHTAALEADVNAIVITDRKGTIQWVNPAYTTLTGYSAEEALGRNPRILKSGKHDDAFNRDMWETISAGRIWQGEFVNKRKDGSTYPEEMTITPVRTGGEVRHFIAIKKDITKRKQLESQLVHAQKMESIGQLAAGIAHEINTPIQYVGDNTRFVRDSLDNLLKLIDQYGTLLASTRDGGVSREQIAAIESAVEDLDLEFVKEEIPMAIEQTLSGVDRVAKIVQAMKDFSHPSGDEKTPTDLNQAIESTITVCRNRWKYVADLETDFQNDLPLVPCHVGEFNQVILNIVVNAADAIGSIVGDGGEGKGRITVSTRQDGEWVEIRVSDTGGGIPEAIRRKVFDPFFTTKKVGKGTGQGLAISHDVIVNKHGGSIDLDSEPGVGTTFIIRLPIAEPTAEKQKEAA